MTILLALALILFLPGFIIVQSFLRNTGDKAAKIGISVGLSAIVVSLWFLLTNNVLKIPFTLFTVIILLVVLWGLTYLLKRLLRLKPQTEIKAYQGSHLFVTIVFVLIIGLAVSPLLFLHDGLPTGDGQKAMLWAKNIIDSGTFPQYQSSILFNRDPVDFYTPGLHYLTASVTILTTNDYKALSWMSVVGSLGIAFLIYAIALRIFRNRVVASLSSLLLFTTFHFHRYIIDPGYHFQNLFGELGILLSLYFFLAALQTKKISYAASWLIVTAGTMLLHQFSAFLLIFLGSVLLVFLLSSRALPIFRNMSRAYKAVTLLAIAVVLVAVFTLPTTELGETLISKVPHIFTKDSHLLDQVIPLNNYANFLGVALSVFAIVGVIIILHKSLRKFRIEYFVLFLWLAVLLVLSQGPRFGIDIPSARTLFYLLSPLSILAAYGLAWLTQLLWKEKSYARLIAIALVLWLISFQAVEVNSRWQRHDPGLGSNASLNLPMLELIEWYKQYPDGRAILIDDASLRKSTWLLMTGKPVLSRLGSDIAVKSLESEQSDLRGQIYLNQADYEKIFMLGNSVEVIALAQKHNLGTIVTAKTYSTSAFLHNSELKNVYENDELVVFAIPRKEVERQSNVSSSASTLVNDIGDRLDTFASLSASVSSTKLSDPILFGNRTARQSLSKYTHIVFNPKAYAPHAWDQNRDQTPDSNVEIDVIYFQNGFSGSLITEAGEIDRQDLTNLGSNWVEATYIIEPWQWNLNEDGLLDLIIINDDDVPFIIDLARARLI